MFDWFIAWALITAFLTFTGTVVTVVCYDYRDTRAGNFAALLTVLASLWPIALVGAVMYAAGMVLTGAYRGAADLIGEWKNG